MKVIGNINLTKASLIHVGGVFAYSKNGEPAEAYMAIELKYGSELHNLFRPLLYSEDDLLPDKFVAVNIERGELAIISNDTMVMEFPTAYTSLTADICPDKE